MSRHVGDGAPNRRRLERGIYRPRPVRGKAGLPVPEPPEVSRGRFNIRDEEAVEAPFNWPQLRRLLGYLAPYRWQVTAAVALMLVTAASRLAVPYLVKLAIDQAIDPAGPAALLSSAERLRLINGYGAAFLAINAVGLLAARGRILLSSRVGQKALHDLRRQLFTHIQQLGFDFYDRRPVGKILVRVTNDINALQDLLQNGLVNTVSDLFMLAGIVGVMLHLHPGLAAATLVVLPVLLALSTRLRRRIRQGWQRVRIKLANINAHLNESIQGIRVTQAFGQERHNIRFFRGMNHDNYRSWMAAVRVSALFSPAVELTGAIGTSVVFWYGAHLLRTGALGTGDIVAFATYVGQFWEPISRLGQFYTQLLVAMASSERIFEFLDTRPDVTDAPRAGEMPPIRGHVRFEHVGFAYEPGRPVLHDIDFEVEPGQTIALVGHTGSGKTTITALLSRFYDPQEGRILIDGVDIRTVRLASLRRQMAVVLQDTFLFQGTVADNIRYGRLDASHAEVEAAARAACAHDFIMAMENGYDTEVRERGSRLSIGQRQLISFARAFLADPRILILDEA
ncbi:MAG TPA: ABC transporter ATP-binding protein, partial [Bacillota bacterium]